MELPPLILASASPRRAELLQQLNLEFQIVPGAVAETFDEQLSPLELCQLNAHRKARVIAKKHPDALVLGADTLVFLEGEIMGKPADVAEARRMLGRLQGRRHQVVTGVSLIHLRALRERTFAVSTDVTFHPLTAEEINGYLSKMNPLDKAGAYAIQEHGDTIVSEISGSFSNVVGLPQEMLKEEIRRWERR
ncbi:MAG TPA: Maf family protein [Candidatus Limnocylindrales bacterium]|nr:Maf family protein [Candidatus Limnocylindrales bacterium]